MLICAVMCIGYTVGLIVHAFRARDDYVDKSCKKLKLISCIRVDVSGKFNSVWNIVNMFSYCHSSNLLLLHCLLAFWNLPQLGYIKHNDGQKS